MNILFKNVKLLNTETLSDVLVCGEHIEYIGQFDSDNSEIKPDRIIDGKENLMLPAFYNAHSHCAMTLFRGYGEDLSLKEWLDSKILPAEDRLNSERVRIGSLLAAAEMIKNGIVSFSDMYMFEDITAKVVSETGMKANLSRCIVSFDEDIDMKNDSRMADAIRLYEEWHKECEGRILIDMSLHAEYTNVEKCCRYVAQFAKEHNLRMQLHASETLHEQEACIKRHNKTPIEFFADTGVLDVPTTAAHCVYVTDSDIELLKDKGVFVAHNPISNLKLGSGIMPYRKLKMAGINIALGTDGAASNNSLDMLCEMRIGALIHKGVNLDPTITVASDMVNSACRIGALSQGRSDCGEIKVGYRADLILIDLESFNNIPSYSHSSTVCYSAKSEDVIMTMCDGRILYENGTYNSIDEEKLKYQAKQVISHYFD